jgi:hypothetical protein
MWSTQQFIKKYLLCLVLLAAKLSLAYPLSPIMRQAPTPRFTKLNQDQLLAMNAEQLSKRKTDLTVENNRFAAKGMSVPALKMELKKTEIALKNQQAFENQRKRQGLPVTKQLPTIYGAVPYTQAQPRGGVYGAWDRMWVGNSGDTYGAYYKDLAAEKSEQKKQQSFLEELEKKEKKERQDRIAQSRQNELFRKAQERERRAAIDKEIEERKKLRQIRAQERAKELERLRATPAYKRRKAEIQAWGSRYDADLAREQAEQEAQEAARLRPFDRLKALGDVPQWQLQEEANWLEEKRVQEEKLLAQQVDSDLERSQQALAQYKEEQRKQQEEQKFGQLRNVWRGKGGTRRPLPLQAESAPSAKTPKPTEEKEIVRELEEGMASMGNTAGASVTSSAGSGAGALETAAQGYQPTEQELKFQKQSDELRADLVKDLAADRQELQEARLMLRHAGGAKAEREAEEKIRQLNRTTERAESALERIEQIPEDLPAAEKQEHIAALRQAYGENRRVLLGAQAEPVGLEVPAAEISVKPSLVDLEPAKPSAGLTASAQQTTQGTGMGLVSDPEVDNAIIALRNNVTNLEQEIKSSKGVGYWTGLWGDDQEKIERAQQEIDIARAALEELDLLSVKASQQERRDYAQAIIERTDRDIKAMNQARSLAKKEKEERVEELRKKREKERAD